MRKNLFHQIIVLCVIGIFGIFSINNWEDIFKRGMNVIGIWNHGTQNKIHYACFSST